MRIALHMLNVKSHLLERLQRPLMAVSAVLPDAMDFHCLLHRIRSRLFRVQRRIGILENHLDIPAGLPLLLTF